MSKAASAMAYPDSHDYYPAHPYLHNNDYDPIPTNPVEFHPDGRRHFDPEKRIYDLPNDKVNHTHNVHKTMINAMVARSMTRSEVMANPKAIEAVNAEWTKLRNNTYIDPNDGVEKMGAWDESVVEEFKDVKARYNKKNLDFHVARMFDLCVEKGARASHWTPDRTWTRTSCFWRK